MKSSDLVDRAGAIREGEELDLGALKAYLEPILGSKVALMEMQQFPGGHSNLTYLLPLRVSNGYCAGRHLEVK